MAEYDDETKGNVTSLGYSRSGFKEGILILGVSLVALCLLGACRRKHSHVETRQPEWLNEKNENWEIPPEWFNSDLKKVVAGTKRIRILQGLDRQIAAVENSPERIAALLSRLEVGPPAVGGPGSGCRCVPDLYLELETAAGLETLSPVCRRRLRLGSLETGRKWLTDPFLTPAAVEAFEGWVEEHGVAWQCCGAGMKSHPDGSLPNSPPEADRHSSW